MVTVTMANCARKLYSNWFHTFHGLVHQCQTDGICSERMGLLQAAGLPCSVHGAGRVTNSPQWVWVLGFIREPTGLELLPY